MFGFGVIQKLVVFVGDRFLLYLRFVGLVIWVVLGSWWCGTVFLCVFG